MYNIMKFAAYSCLTIYIFEYRNDSIFEQIALGKCVDLDRSDQHLHCLPLCLHLLDAFEPRHDKTNKMSVRPAKTPISLGIRPV